MTPLWLGSVYEDYEIRNNIIIFKENGKITYEFPIPKNYTLIGIIENFHFPRLFMFSEYKLEPPKVIPKGYTNLKLSSYGLYKVESEEPFLYSNGNIKSKRELYYMDTSYITTDDFNLACNGHYTISKKDIPKNFWFSIQFRDLINENCKIIGWRDWSCSKDIIPYVKEFDERARLINEYEFISILSYNRHGKPHRFLMDDDIYEKYCATNKIFLGGAWVDIENFFQMVSSMENPEVYLCVRGENNIDNVTCTYESHSCYKVADEAYPWFGISIIEDQIYTRILK